MSKLKFVLSMTLVLLLAILAVVGGAAQSGWLTITAFVGLVCFWAGLELND